MAGGGVGGWGLHSRPGDVGSRTRNVATVTLCVVSGGDSLCQGEGRAGTREPGEKGDGGKQHQRESYRTGTGTPSMMWYYSARWALD